MTLMIRDPIDRSKVQVTTPINAQTENAPYISNERPTNFKPGTRMEYDEPHH